MRGALSPWADCLKCLGFRSAWACSTVAVPPSASSFLFGILDHEGKLNSSIGSEGDPHGGRGERGDHKGQVAAEVVAQVRKTRALIFTARTCKRGWDISNSFHSSWPTCNTVPPRNRPL
eukprot:9478127-Pyramimonas_sp.AAC.1